MSHVCGDTCNLLYILLKANVRPSSPSPNTQPCSGSTRIYMTMDLASLEGGQLIRMTSYY